MRIPPVILVDTHAKLSDGFLAGIRQRGEMYVRHELSPADLKQISPRTEILVISGGTKVSREYIESLPALRLIADHGVGYDGVDVPAARKRGILISHTPGAMNDDVADTALALLLNCARRFCEADAFVRAGKWPEGAFPLSTSLRDLKAGILGLGRIGMQIAERLAACKCVVGYHARNPKPNVPWQYFADLKSLAAWSDALILALPAGPKTRGIITREILTAIGSNGYLINISRGSIVDEPALLEALENGGIRGAGLDVFDAEPRISPRFAALSNVVLSPHMGSSTLGSRSRMAKMVLDNLDAYLSGSVPPNLIPELR